MSVFKHRRGKTYRYDFRFNGKRYAGNTHQITETDAQLAERELQLKLRHQAGGIAQFFPQQTTRLEVWSQVFLTYKKARLSRPDHLVHITRVLMRFWGAPQSKVPKSESAPYHDLRLGDPISDPSWLLKFEDWMTRRGIGNQSKNHYRGVLRRMYALALRAEYRQTTGIAVNPFAGLERDPTPGRTVTLSAPQVQAWLEAASYHVRLAISIAALAPKLRLANVLALRWDESFEPDPRRSKFNPRVPHYLVVRHHKTERKTGRPLVTPINRQLLRILKDAWRRHPAAPHVVTFRSRRIKSIRDGVKAAAEAAGLPYGRATEDGATFHTLRHTAATLLSGVEANPLTWMDATGHTDFATALRYRHMQPTHERPALERLSKTLPIEKLVTVARSRAKRPRGASSVISTGGADQTLEKSNKVGAHLVRTGRRQTR